MSYRSPFTLIIGTTSAGKIASPALHFRSGSANRCGARADAPRTFRIPAGALLAAGAVAHISPEWAFLAALLGGSLTSGSHFTKAGSRALINLSPEPFSNWAASFGEDFMVAGGLWAALFAPVLFLGGLALFLLLMIWTLPKIWRGVRLVLKRNRDEQVQPVTER